MNLESLVKLLADHIGLDFYWHAKNQNRRKTIVFVTKTGIEVTHVALISKNGYDWSLDFNRSDDSVCDFFENLGSKCN